MIDPISRIDPKHLVNLKGKMHPTYPGVLAAALESGLRSLGVKVVQFPSAANGQLAVCEALAVFTQEDGREITFAEVGDCDNENCGKHIAPHKVRMAATRAKGRALRDALGIGVALREEMSDEGDAVQPYQPTPRTSPPVRHERPQAVGAGDRPPNGPRGRDGGQAAPVASPVAGEPAAADETPILRCGWLKCGKPMSVVEAALSMRDFGHLVCPEHTPAAEAYFAKQQQPPAETLALQAEAESVSAQAKGY